MYLEENVHKNMSNFDEDSGSSLEHSGAVYSQ